MELLNKTEKILKQTANQSLLQSSYDETVEMYNAVLQNYLDVFSPSEEVREKLQLNIKSNSQTEIIKSLKKLQKTAEESEVLTKKLEVNNEANFVANSLTEGARNTVEEGDNNIFTISDVVQKDGHIDSDNFIFEVKNVDSLSMRSSDDEGVEPDMLISGIFDEPEGSFSASTTVTSELLEIVSQFNELSQEIQDVLSGINEAISVVDEIFDTASDFVTAASDVLDKADQMMGGFMGEIGKFLQMIGEGGELLIILDEMREDLNNLEDVMDNIGDEIDKYQDIIDDVIDVGDNIGEFTGGIEELVNYLKEVQGMIDTVKDYLDDYILDPVEKFKNEVLHSIRDFRKDIKDKLDELTDPITDPINEKFDEINDFTDGVIDRPIDTSDEFRDKFNAVFNSKKAEISSIFDPVIEGVEDKIKAQLDEVLDPVKQDFESFVRGMVDDLKDRIDINIAGGVLDDQIGNLLDGLGQDIEGRFEGYIDGIVGKVDDIFDLVYDKVDDAFDNLFDNTVNLIQSEFNSLVNRLADDIEEGRITEVEDLQEQLNDGYHDAINNALDEALTPYTDLIDDIYAIIDSEALSIVHDIQAMLEEISDLFDDVILAVESIAGINFAGSAADASDDGIEDIEIDFGDLDVEGLGSQIRDSIINSIDTSSFKSMLQERGIELEFDDIGAIM